MNKTKQNCCLSLFNSLIYLLEGETANHVNFMQHMLVSYSSCCFSSLEVNIVEVSKILTSGNLFELVIIQYHLLGQFRPVLGRHRDL